MPLFVPDPTGRQGFDARSIYKGQIYNVDDNEKMSFQFNPEAFRWTSTDVWVPTGIGVFGRDVSYVREESSEFGLTLLFVADPGAPALKSEGVKEDISPVQDGIQADFDQVVVMLDRWRARRPDSGRPSLLKLIISPGLYFDAVITKVERAILERFEDGSTREGQLDMNFLVWKPIGTES